MRLLFNYFSIFCLLSCVQISAAQASPSFFADKCAELKGAQNQPIAYINSKSEYVANIQMLETFKKFKDCQALDQNLMLAPEYQAKSLEIENVFKRTFNIKPATLDNLNAKALSIFNSTKNNYLILVKELENQSSESLKKGSYTEIAKRISSVRLIKSKVCNMHNASYDPVTHSINICREILNYPEATLISIIAHELSHAIDPCILQFELSEIKSSNPFFKKDSVFDQHELDGAYTTLPAEWAENDFDVLKENLELVSDKISFEKNPFNKNIQCLQGPNSVRASARKSPIKNLNIEDPNGMCSAPASDGEIQEAFADWMGYELLARHIEKLGSQAKHLALTEGVLNITANECSSLESAIEKEMRKQMEHSKICAPKVEKFFNQIDKMRSQKLIGSHPNGQRRVDRLFAVQPYIKSQLKKFFGFRTDASIDKAALQYCRP